MIVEDERRIAAYVKRGLEEHGYAVDAVHSGQDALYWAGSTPYDMILLDILLPAPNGLAVCRELRRQGSRVPILMLTARGAVDERVAGLDAGADDYLAKPFSPRELTARIRAMLRRPRRSGSTGPGHQDGRSFGSLRVDPEARKVWLDQREVDLTRTEFDLLDTLTQQPKRAFSRRQLIDAVWGTDWYGDEHIVDVHVAHLRKKLDDDAASPTYIRTVRGVGYGMAS